MNLRKTSLLLFNERVSTSIAVRDSMLPEAGIIRMRLLTPMQHSQTGSSYGSLVQSALNLGMVWWCAFMA